MPDATAQLLLSELEKRINQLDEMFALRKPTTAAELTAFYQQNAQGPSWLGIPVFKNPCDLMLYQELITRIKPDVIVECGTADGGSAVFFASICALRQHGQVITIDKEERPPSLLLPNDVYKRIIFIKGSSIDKKTLTQVAWNAKDKCVLVSLDSDHSADHVLAELRAYSRFVSLNSYIVVEDTNCLGPRQAVQEFLIDNDDFVIDEALAERFLITYNPGGWLKRVRA